MESKTQQNIQQNTQTTPQRPPRVPLHNYPTDKCMICRRNPPVYIISPQSPESQYRIRACNLCKVAMTNISTVYNENDFE